MGTKENVQIAKDCFAAIAAFILAKPLVLKARKRVPRGFDSHLPPCFS
jgi:hypothetical protein